MPEAEAITENLNGFLFEENNVADLTLKIENWLNTHTDREKMRYSVMKLSINITILLTKCRL